MTSSLTQHASLTVSTETVATKTKGFYIPCLDGIRAVSFMVVFLGHVGLGHIIPAGFGVTVFFFLSGYLITSLLRREFETTGNISLRHFYMRRVLRIFPPLYLTLLFMLAMSLIGLLPSAMYGDAVGAQFVFMTNYYRIFGAHPGGFPSGSIVLWSLSVEEHFYMVFPLFAVWSMSRFSAARQTMMLGFACVVVLIWRCVLVYHLKVDAQHTYMATDSRIDAMLYGCMLAIMCNPYMDKPLHLGKKIKLLMYAFLTGLLLVSFLYRSGTFRATWRYSIQSVALLPLFYLAITDWKKPWFAWLNWQPIRFLGMLSYTLYLIHHSMINYVDYRWAHINPIGRGIGAFVLSLVFALLMYFCVERVMAAWRRQMHKPIPKQI